jgi:uncharacterized protein YndB with AHSA1/START domain
MIDIHAPIRDTHRAVGAGRIAAGEARTVLLRRTYPAPPEEVWDACTSADRIARWFLPVTGDLRAGGKYQLEGNAGGEILRCEPPHLLRVTWLFGGSPPAEVELRLSPAPGGGTVLELEHTAVVDPAFWARFGPGAVGVGWDLALLGLGVHLSGGVRDGAEVQRWLQSPDGRGFASASSEAWGAAYIAGGAEAAEAASAVRNTTAFYTGAPGTPA